MSAELSAEMPAGTVARTRRLAGAAVGIPPRQMDFRLPVESPRWFYDDNATATLFFAMLSAWFPPGERFFMESVRHYRERITDARLKAEVAGFMGQEAIHGREHERLNGLLAERGIDLRFPTAAVKLGLRALEQLPPSTQLAATTFMEHFTALLAEQLLTDPHFCSKADPEMIKLWQWHALEELEHKAVAYDVYELAGNSRRERIVAGAAVTAALLPAALASWAWLVLREGKATNVKDLRRGVGLLLGRGGFVSRILPKMSLFWRPGYHPRKHRTQALEAKWREIMFGADGILNGELRNREAVGAP